MSMGGLFLNCCQCIYKILAKLFSPVFAGNFLLHYKELHLSTSFQAAAAEVTQGLGYVIRKAALTLIFSRLIHLYLRPAIQNEGGI